MERERESEKSNSEKCIHGDTAQVGISFSSGKQRLIWLSEMNEFQRVDCTRVQHTPHSNIFCIILHNFFFFRSYDSEKNPVTALLLKFKSTFVSWWKAVKHIARMTSFPLTPIPKFGLRTPGTGTNASNWYDSFLILLFPESWTFVLCYFSIFTRNEFHAI